ncbi:MAG: hypothetical protein U0271_23155 [Polyangiaceae bacterium]
MGADLVAFVVLALVFVLWLSWPQHRRSPAPSAFAGRRPRDAHPYRSVGSVEPGDDRAPETDVPVSLRIARARMRARDLHREGSLVEAARLVLEVDGIALATTLPILIDASRFAEAEQRIDEAEDAELARAWTNAVKPGFITHDDAALVLLAPRRRWLTWLTRARARARVRGTTATTP